jgi:hypothetical protein
MLDFSIIQFYTRIIVIKRNVQVEFYISGVRVGLMHKPTMRMRVILRCTIPARPLIGTLTESLRPEHSAIR